MLTVKDAIGRPASIKFRSSPMLQICSLDHALCIRKMPVAGDGSHHWGMTARFELKDAVNA